VGKDFLYPLETFVGLCVPDAARVEVNLFREVVATSALRVTVGGYWDVTRATMTS
ncbi:Gustatory receptor 19, partial [Frankliniella occidentalis]